MNWIISGGGSRPLSETRRRMHFGKTEDEAIQARDQACRIIHGAAEEVIVGAFGAPGTDPENKAVDIPALVKKQAEATEAALRHYFEGPA